MKSSRNKPRFSPVDLMYLASFLDGDERTFLDEVAEFGYAKCAKVRNISVYTVKKIVSVMKTSWFSDEQHRRRLDLIAKAKQPPKDYRRTTEIIDLELEQMVAKRIFQSIDSHRVFRYADNLNDAHRVIEHMRKLNFVVRLDNGLDGTWEATFYKPAETAHGPNDQFYAPENTLARAICVSALKAVGAPEMEGADE